MHPLYPYPLIYACYIYARYIRTRYIRTHYTRKNKDYSNEMKTFTFFLFPYRSKLLPPGMATAVKRQSA